MSGKFAGVNRIAEELTKVSKLYNQYNVASAMASSLSPLIGSMAYENVGTIADQMNLGVASSAFEARHVLPDVALQLGVAAEAQSIMSQNLGIVQALENTMSYASKLGSIGSSGVLGHLDWIQDNGLAAALGRNIDYQSQIARTLDLLQSSFKEAVNYSDALGSMSSAIIGLSSVIRNAVPDHSVIADICGAMSSSWDLWESVPQVDKDILCDVADKVLSRPEEWTLDSAAEAIANEYDFEIEKQVSNIQPAVKESLNAGGSVTELPQTQKIDAEKIRDWILAIITILSFLFDIFSSSDGINISVNNSFNTVNETNHYYVTECNVNAEFLNGLYYRIINRETIARLKRDCHSPVTGRLKAGQVVRYVISIENGCRSSGRTRKVISAWGGFKITKYLNSRPVIIGEQNGGGRDNEGITNFV